MLLPTNGLVKGSVGVRYYPATEDHPPLRVFYPTTTSTTAATTAPAASEQRRRRRRQRQPYRWLQEHGVYYYLNGYVRMFLGKRRSTSWLVRLITVPLLLILSRILPVRWRRLPHGTENAPLPTVTMTNGDVTKLLPVIFFSHGLTGTGQENSLLLAAWASTLHCYAVSVHHTDGSSTAAPRHDGTTVYYEHGPSFENYDAEFRPRQNDVRAKEILQACDFILSPNNDDFRNNADRGRLVVAGFSYGAATALRVLTMLDEDDDHDTKKHSKHSSSYSFQAAVLLDGWLYIDVSESAGVEFPFPREAFEAEASSSIDKIPKVFINSEQFQSYKKLYQATCELAAKSGPSQTSSNNKNRHVIPGTGHQNFCEGIFWFPTFLLRRVLGPALGKTRDPVDAYREILDISSNFLNQHLNGGKPIKQT